MKCDKCGKTIDTNALVCPFCKAELQSPTEEIEVLDFDTVVEEIKPSTVLDEKKSSDDKKEEKKEEKKKEDKKEEKKKKDSKKTSAKKDKKEEKPKEKEKTEKEDKTKKEEKEKVEKIEEKPKEDKHEEKESNKKEEETKKETEQLLEKLEETQEKKLEDVSELSEKEIDKTDELKDDSTNDEEEKLDVTNFERTFVELPEGLVEKIDLSDDEEIIEDNKQPVIETEETIDLSSLDTQSVVDELIKDKVDNQEPQIISSKDITEEDKEKEQPELIMEPTIIAESIEDVSELPNQSVEGNENEEENTGSYEPFVDSESIVPLPPKKTLKYRIKDFYRSWFEGYEKAPEIKVDDRETRLTLEKIYERSTKEAQEKPISSADVGMVWLICFVIAFISFFMLTVLSFIVDIILGDANNTSLLTVIIPVFQIGVPLFFILFGWAIGIVYSYIKRKADRK